MNLGQSIRSNAVSESRVICPREIQLPESQSSKVVEWTQWSERSPYRHHRVPVRSTALEVR